MVTQTLSTVPMVVNVHHYGGDTLSVRIVVNDATVAGRDWDAQIRKTQDAEEIDATFDIVPGAMDEWFLVLPGAVVSDLLATKSTVVRVDGKPVTRYIGVYDAQVSDAGSDPIQTFVQGTMTIDLDVTRRIG
jgi:uncharacterized protein with LGFP repeats